MYKNTKGENEFLEALAEGGFQVGKMAMLLYPHGIEVTAKSNEESLVITKDLVQSRDEIVLFEPAFEFEGLLVRVDILVKSGNSVELIEVKAKSYDSKNPSIEGARTPIRSEFRPYIEDIAFQKYVVANALPSCAIQTFLMMPDKSVSATTNGLNQCFRIKAAKGLKEAVATTEAPQQVTANKTLLTKLPVDDYVDHIMHNPLEYPGSEGSTQNHLPERVKIWASKYQVDEKIDPHLHKGCKDCEFRTDNSEDFKSGYHECLTQVTQLTREEIDRGTVLDIWRYRKKDDLLQQQIYKIEDAIDFIEVESSSNGLSYKERQHLQVAGIPEQDDKGGFYFDSDYFNKLKTEWSYPYHFIDFETCTVALPFFEGMRPYESIAFQFSHHVMDADGKVEHRSQTLLTDPGTFPNFEFVRNLKNSLDSDSGTIFRWAAHENTILNHIREQLETSTHAPSDKSDLIEFIVSVTNDSKRTMVDLNEIALKCYFHPATQGRTSIKKVLPAVLKTSEALSTEYSKPIGEVSTSLNFPDSFIWFRQFAGSVIDPYHLLKLHTTELFQASQSTVSLENLMIAEGGAAAMAYARLQFEEMSQQERANINDALLRYCELDTLAMVMILKSWIDWSH